MEFFGIFDSSSCSSYSCDVHSGRWSPFYFLKLGQHRREGRLEEKRGKICKRRNLHKKCIAREILESSICDPLINRLSSARSKLSTVSVKQDTRCVQRRQEGRELTELYVQLQVQACHIKNIKKREFETSVLQSRPHWITGLMRKVREKVKRN